MVLLVSSLSVGSQSISAGPTPQAVGIAARVFAPSPEGIAGTVTDGSANPASGICVSVFDGAVLAGFDVTSGTGDYEATVGAGFYTVFFDECSPGVLGAEWYDDAATQGAAASVEVVAKTVTAGIDAQLAFDVLCNGMAPTMWDTSGPDIIEGTDGPDVIVGLAGKDTLSGMAGIDTMCGGNGDDRMSGGAGADSMFGEAGTDTVDYTNSVGPVEVDLEAGTATGEGADSISGFENVTGSDHDDTISGDGNPNVLRG